jgi:hypothetical protein
MYRTSTQVLCLRYEELRAAGDSEIPGPYRHFFPCVSYARRRARAASDRATPSCRGLLVSRRKRTEGCGTLVGCGMAAPESVVLEEEIDQNYEPTQDEIVEYATWLGMVSLSGVQPYCG